MFNISICPVVLAGLFMIVNATCPNSSIPIRPAPLANENMTVTTYPCYENVCQCSSLITYCENPLANHTFPPNNDLTNSSHCFIFQLKLGSNCNITIDPNLITMFPQLTGITFDGDCKNASYGCVSYDGPPYFNLTNNLFCKESSTTTTVVTTISTLLSSTQSSEASTTSTFKTPTPSTEITTNSTVAPSTHSTETSTKSTAAPSSQSTETSTKSTAAPSTQSTETSTKSTAAPSTLSTETSTKSTAAPTTQSTETSTKSTAAPSTQSTETSIKSTSAPSTQSTETSTKSTAAPSTLPTETSTKSTAAPSTQSTGTSTKSTAEPSTQSTETSTKSTAAPSTQSTETSTKSTAAPSTQSTETSTISTAASSTQSTETSTKSTAAPSTQSTETSTNTTFASPTPSSESSTKSNPTSATQSTESSLPTTSYIDCQNKAGNDMCKTYLDNKLCSFPSILQQCELTCNPRCQTTTEAPSTTPKGPTYDCKPSYSAGKEFNSTGNDTDGTYTCCDTLGTDCAALINTTKSSASTQYNSILELCQHEDTGSLMSQCSFSCGACNDVSGDEHDQKLSGVNFTEACRDDFKLPTCISLLTNNYCTILAARQNCWQTCDACKLDVPASVESPIFPSWEALIHQRVMAEEAARRPAWKRWITELIWGSE